MSYIEYKSCVKYVGGKSVQSFFFPCTWQWKSPKWKKTERLIRRSRFCCSGSNENQMTSTVIHLRQATPLCTHQALVLYWNGSQKVRDTGVCRGSSPCVTYGEQSVAMCHYFHSHIQWSLIKSDPTTYWSLPAIWIPQSTTVPPQWSTVVLQSPAEAHWSRAQIYYLGLIKKKQIMGDITYIPFENIKLTFTLVLYW